jgi:hypothetical protein
MCLGVSSLPGAHQPYAWQESAEEMQTYRQDWSEVLVYCTSVMKETFLNELHTMLKTLLVNNVSAWEDSRCSLPRLATAPHGAQGSVRTKEHGVGGWGVSVGEMAQTPAP